MGIEGEILVGLPFPFLKVSNRIEFKYDYNFEYE